MAIVLILVSSVLLFYFIKKKYKIYLVGRKIAGPWALPLLGNVQMISNLKPEYLFLFITENRAKFKQTYRLWLGPELWVFLHSPQETRDALNDPTLVRADTFHQLSVLIGNGLLISEGKYWDSHRRALGPAFHPVVLNSFAPTIQLHVDELIAKIQNSLKGSIEVTDFLFPCILDIIVDTSMGKNLNAQHDQTGKYTQAFHNTSKLLFKRMVNPLLGSDFLFKRTAMHKQLAKSLKVIHDLMEDIIRNRIGELENRGDFKMETEDEAKKRLTLLDTLLTTDIDGRKLSFREIRDEANTFLFAGVDTTTAAMAFVLYCLAKYPAEQQKVYEEIQSATEPNGKDVSVAQLNSLTYLTMFLQEVMRLYTIVPMTGRQTTTDTQIGGRHYCAGITIWINMYGLAHDEDLFERPYEFWPERFSKENLRKMEAYSYLPFSAGPHICIGRKYAMLIMKILTVKLLQQFSISLKDPDEELILMAQMVLKSLNGINLVFKNRNQ